MPYAFTNSKGTTYYLHAKGKMFFFSREVKEGVLDAVPTGHTVFEMKTGMLVLKRNSTETEVKQEDKGNLVPVNNTIAEKKTFTLVPNLNTFSNKLDNRVDATSGFTRAESKRPLRVFLCHAHSDSPIIRALFDRLNKDNVDAWLDKEKLLPGSDWEYEIRRAVRESDVVVVCLSKNFNQQGFRQKEVRLALDTAMEQPEGEIFIIPARLEECDNLESLRKWHWVDLFESDGYERLMRALKARAQKVGAVL